jgi:hypothetical protein
MSRFSNVTPQHLLEFFQSGMQVAYYWQRLVVDG